MDLKKVNKLWLVCLVVLSLISCDKNKTFDTYLSLKNGEWSSKNKVMFTVEVTDTVYKQDILLNLRTDNSYPYRNLFLISKLTTPKGLVVKDTLEYLMADVYGNWLGEGFTDVRNNSLLFLENYKFNKSGTYIFEFEQAVRKRGQIDGDKVLKGVLDVGLRIEKSIK